MTDHQPHPPIDETAEDQLLDHEYDGIQEYDNPLPLWWKAIFWGTILFTPLYVIFYHFGPGVLPNQKYDNVMTAFYEKQAQELLELGEITDTVLNGLRKSDSMMETAHQVFTQKCASCHGVFGEGGIGPNLSDEYWIHGNRLTQIYETIVEGVPEKGMLSWKRQLPPAQLMALAAYVANLQDTSPPNPKEPQGDPLDPAGMVVVEDGATPDDEAAPGEEGTAADAPEESASSA